MFRKIFRYFFAILLRKYLPDVEMKSLLMRSHVIQSVVITMITTAVLIADPNQNTPIRTQPCVFQNFLKSDFRYIIYTSGFRKGLNVVNTLNIYVFMYLTDGAQLGYKLSCNIMSVTMRAVIKVPNQVPVAAAFIILQ